MRPGISYLMLTVSIVAVTAAQLLIKARFNVLGLGASLEQGVQAVLRLVLTDPPLWVAGFLMLAGAALWYISMSRLPLSFILPCAALISPMAAIGAHFLLGEDLSLSKLLAIFTITAGVIWLGSLQSS